MGKRLSNKEFLKRLHRIHGSSIIPLEKYKFYNTKIWFKCAKHNHKFHAAPKHILEGQGCPECYRLSRRNDPKLFPKRVKKLYKNEYTILTPYIDENTNVLIRHNKCGNIFKMTPTNFLEGQQCPRCSRNKFNKRQTFTIKDFKRKVFNLFGYKYTVIGHYVNEQTKIAIRHNKCGNVFYPTPDHFLHFCSRCPYCNKESIGEFLVAKYLKDHNIKYFYGYKLHMYQNKRKCLHLDFYIKNLNIGIEFDGRQHKHPVKHFGGIKKFKITKKHDNEKNIWCKNHNIFLIRIPAPICAAYKYINRRIKQVLNQELLPKI